MPCDPVVDSVAAGERAEGRLCALDPAPAVYVTVREVSVLRLVADGLSNAEIAARLGMSEETVKSHVRHLLAKLGALTRAHAVAKGIRRGVIS